MSFVDGDKLEEILIRTLAKRSEVSALWLQEQISQTSRMYSLQAIYKELRKLLRKGIVYKVKEYYGLRAAWVLEAAQVVEEMSKTYIANPSDSSVLPELGEKRSWAFTDLHKMDSFWTNAMLILLRHSEEKEMYQWLPHAWFHLTGPHHQIEEKYQKAVRRTGGTIYISVGGNMYLDKAFSRLWPKDIYRYTHARSPFHKNRHEYFNVIGSYVLTARFDRETVKLIEEMFAETKNQYDFNAGKVLHIFHRSVRIRLTLEDNETKARSLKEKFGSIFPVDEKYE